MPPTTHIIVTPLKDDGYRVEIDGERVADFTGGGQAAVEYALRLLEVRRLKQVIDDHAGWLHSRTPDQVNNLDAGTLRAMAQELRFLGGING